MGAVALAIQAVIPLIVALDVTTLSTDPAGHAHHRAVVSHLREQALHPAGDLSEQDHGTASPSSHKGDAHGSAACPVCLALHAASGILAAAAPPPPLVSLPDETRNAAIAREISFPCPAAYLSRAPPRLA